MKMDLTKEELAYSQQKNREHIWIQAKQERVVFKKEHSDSSLWNSFDEAWTDFRYIELCEKANITRW
jgi:hypothetical protein